MTDCLLLILSTWLGAGVGSFALAQVEQAEQHKAKKSNKKQRFSVCDTCGQRLAWFEVLPIFSYILQFGKCRHCGAKIPIQTFLVELLGGAIFFFTTWAFLQNGDFSVLAILQFVISLAIFSLLLLASLWDFKTLKMPNKVFLPAFLLALVYFLLNLLKSGDILSAGQGLFFALLPISGIYGLFYIISQGKLVGMADMKFGFIAALLLPNWWATTFILLTANVIALLYYPLLKNKNKRQKSVAMIPALSLALFIIYLCKTASLF